MDWSFACGCSPPRLSTTQLPSATDRPVLLSDEDFHPIVGAYFQAHSLNRFAVNPTDSQGLNAGFTLPGRLVVPKGQKDLAQGFNPGFAPPDGALKGHEFGEVNPTHNVHQTKHRVS
jgi:hypothetical protein